jgi:hypothetical protein
VTTGVDWFGRLYGDGYRGLLLTAYALLEDFDEAGAVTRDALAVAYGRRIRLALEDSPLEWVRAEVVRRARRRQRWRALPHRPAIDRDAEAVRLHRLAGLPPETIASVVDLPADAVAAALADAGPVSWASVRQPVVDRIRVRAAQRTSRKRTLAAALAAIVVLAVVVPLLRVEEPPAPAAATAPSTSWTPPPAPRQIFIAGVQFADDHHVFALRADCPSSDCDLDLLASDDGRHWTSRPVRKPAQDRPMMGVLLVLGPLEVAVDWFPVTAASAEVYRVHSTDGGRSWKSVAAEPRGTLSHIPAGGVLQPSCLGDLDRCTDFRPSVVVPGTGSTGRLTSAPRLEQAYPGVVPLDGNRWWIAGIVPGTQQWAVSISSDSGRTWTTSRLVRPRTNISDSWSVVGYGNDLYACAMGQVDSDDFAMVSIFHSTDGGRSWRLTSGAKPLRTSSALVAAADGTLLTNTEGGDMLVSHDQGRTFTRTATRFTGYAYWAGAGYVAADSSRHRTLFSRDGLSWQELNLKQ